MNETRRPTAELKAEHQVILRSIAVLKKIVDRCERSGTFEYASLARCVEFFRGFADACHHAKEEDLLFPVMETRGIPRENGPIGVMLYEHRLARGYTCDMGTALESFDKGEPDAVTHFCAAARQYIELLSNHIQKEDHILFNMGDQVMSDDDQQTLCGKFCEVGCRTFHGKKREELERIIDELELAELRA